MEPKSTTHTTPHKHQPIATGASHKFVVNHCNLVDIKAFCAHTGGKAGAESKEEPHAPPKPGPPAPPAKPGTPPPKPGEPPPPGGGQRLAKEDESPLPSSGRPGPPTGRPPQPPAPGHPSAPGHPPAPAPPKPLLLQVVPTAPEGPERSAESHGVKVTPASPSHSAGGDTVTLVATMDGECSQYPQWTIKDLSHLNSKLQPPPAGKKKWTYAFLPPAPLIGVKRFLGTAWLEDVQPRKYKVTCIAKQHQPTAHHELHVWVYPPGKASLEISSEAGPKPPWEANLDKLKEAIKVLFTHISQLTVVQNGKIDLLEGSLEIKNGWKEIEDSNLVHWKADAEAKLELIKVAIEVPVSIFAFLHKVDQLAHMLEAGKKLERFFEKTTGVQVQAGLYLTVTIGISLGGSGSWEKDEHGNISANMEKMYVEEGASIGLEAKLIVKSDKAGDLAVLSGKASSDMSLKTSPRLEPGPQFWLDSTFDWKPLDIELHAKVNNIFKKAPPSKATHSANQPISKKETAASADAPDDNSLIDLSWSGHVLPEIKDHALPSIDILSGNTGTHPLGKNVLAIRPRQAPPPKPVAAPGPTPPSSAKL